MEKRNLLITTSISSLIALERMVSSRAAMAPMLYTQLIIVIIMFNVSHLFSALVEPSLTILGTGNSLAVAHLS